MDVLPQQRASPQQPIPPSRHNLDVIKTRMQTDKTGRYKGLIDCIGQVGTKSHRLFFERTSQVTFRTASSLSMIGYRCGAPRALQRSSRAWGRG